MLTSRRRTQLIDALRTAMTALLFAGMAYALLILFLAVFGSRYYP